MVYSCIGQGSVEWAGNTYGEIREIGGKNGSVLVVPVGSIEQHGHHMPVATDTILVDAVCTEAAERAAEDLPVLVSPPVWSGYSPHHLSFGGTLSAALETLQKLLEDVARTGLENGFDAVFVVNGHGGNRSILGTALAEIGLDHPEVEVVGITYFELAREFIDDIRESDLGGMSHAGEFETSLMLHLRPELVDMEAATGTYGSSLYERGRSDMLDSGSLVNPFTAIESHSQSGAIGDPSLASAEKGAEIHEELLEAMVSQLREVHDQVRS